MTKFYLRLYCHTPVVEEDIRKGDTPQLKGQGFGVEECPQRKWVDVTALGVHPDLAQRLGELGIIDYHRGFVPARQAERLRRVLRLRRNLGVNLPGAAIIVDLLERIEELEDELERLRRLGYK